jgi:hypothetical protein
MTALPHDVATDLRRENARLQAELRAARDRQNASAEILRAVAGAPGDVERLLQRIAEITERLFGASSVTIRTIEGEEWGRLIRVGDGSKRISQEIPEAQLRPGARNLASAVVLENRQIHIPDLDNVDPAIADWPGLRPARAAGIRVIVGTPLRWEGKAIGALMVQRDRPEPFTAEELALQQSFADQAVIAIENARLAGGDGVEEGALRLLVHAFLRGVLAHHDFADQPLRQCFEPAARLRQTFVAQRHSVDDGVGAPDDVIAHGGEAVLPVRIPDGLGLRIAQVPAQFLTQGRDLLLPEELEAFDPGVDVDAEPAADVVKDADGIHVGLHRREAECSLPDSDLTIEVRPPDRHAVGSDGQHKAFAGLEAQLLGSKGCLVCQGSVSGFVPGSNLSPV